MKGHVLMHNRWRLKRFPELGTLVLLAEVDSLNGGSFARSSKIGVLGNSARRQRCRSSFGVQRRQIWGDKRRCVALPVPKNAVQDHVL